MLMKLLNVCNVDIDWSHFARRVLSLQATNNDRLASIHCFSFMVKSLISICGGRYED